MRARTTRTCRDALAGRGGSRTPSLVWSARSAVSGAGAVVVVGSSVTMAMLVVVRSVSIDDFACAAHESAGRSAAPAGIGLRAPAAGRRSE